MKPRASAIRSAAFALLLAAALRAGAAETSYAEKLGWSKTDRVVIFHSDDLGLSHGTNTGSIEAMEKGLVTSSSVMMPTPWVPEIVRYAKANPDKDFGLHLTLTSEWRDYRWDPVCGKPAAPGLVDPEGAMWGDVAEVIKNASPDEVEREIRAQIERAETMGMPVTHLDSHMGTLFADARFFERYMKVGIEKKIPILAAGGHLQHASKENPMAVMMLRPLAKKLWDAGLPVLDDIHTDSYGWRNKEEKVRKYVEMIRTLKPGVTEVIMHCIHDTCEFPPISDSGPVRIGDFEAMMHPDLRRAVEEEKIILTTWRELMERRKKAGP